MVRGEGVGLFDVSASDLTPMSLVGAVRLASGSGGSSARERLTKPLLVRSQYRAARVIMLK